MFDLLGMNLRTAHKSKFICNDSSQPYMTDTDTDTDFYFSAIDDYEALEPFLSVFSLTLRLFAA